MCPAREAVTALFLRKGKTDAMNLRCIEIAAAVARNAHAIVILDKIGWYFSRTLQVPDAIPAMVLPSRCPELNPVKNVWQFVHANWLSNRVFKS